MAEKAKLTGVQSDPMPEGVLDFHEKKTKLVATDKAPFHTDGEEFEAHPILAKDFIKRGFAVEAKEAKD